MKEQDKQAPVVHNTFNAPIGQYVQYQHIENMTIGSDGQIHVASSSQPAPHPQHIEDAEIVEEVKDIVTANGETSPEETNTEDDSQAVILQKRQKALDMIMKCESFFKSNTQQIIKQAFDQLCEDKYAHLDDALSGQSFNTTVCRMIGVALDVNLFETTKKRDLGKCVEEKEIRLSWLTAEKYIGDIHETPQQRLLKSWRKYLQTVK